MKLDRPSGEFGAMKVGVWHTGLKPEQNWSRRTVLRGMGEGWASLNADETELTIRAEPEDLVYTVTRAPGYYCRSTGERIPISKFALEEVFTQMVAVMAAREAQAWCKANGKRSNDYEVTQAYECVLREDQHERFRGVPAPSGALVAAHTLED
jgi:hypothetical protein